MAALMELRKEKKQLALETELAAANVKLHVLEINSRCGSHVSNGMSSCFEKNSVQGKSKKNPSADNFNPKVNVVFESHPGPGCVCQD